MKDNTEQLQDQLAALTAAIRNEFHEGELHGLYPGIAREVENAEGLLIDISLTGQAEERLNRVDFTSLPVTSSNN